MTDKERQSPVTSNYLRDNYTYNMLTGDFTPKNSDVTSISVKSSYPNIRLLGKTYNLSRVIWLYVFGKWPNNVIDHINGNSHDNWIQNLRDVTQYENIQNRNGFHLFHTLSSCIISKPYDVNN